MQRRSGGAIGNDRSKVDASAWKHARGHRDALRVALLSLSIGLAAVHGYAQPLATPSRPIALFGGATLSENFSSASISAFEQGAECGVFQTGSARRPSFFVGLALPIGDRWSFDPTLTLSNLSSSFTTPASAAGFDPNALRLSTGSFESIHRDRYYDANLKALLFSADLSIDVYRGISLSAGPYVGAFVSHSYIETEKIASPSDAVYRENLLSTRTIGEGALAVHTFQAGLDLGIDYQLAFQRNLTLRPSIRAALPITTVSDRSTSAWRVFPVGASLAIDYTFPERTLEAPPQPTLAAWDSMLNRLPIAKSPPTPLSPLHVAIKAFGVSDDGSQIEEPVLSVERMHVTEVYPMLHYVFFDDGSSAIPDRYRPKTQGAFDERALYSSSALEIHHHVLDILGKRMKESPSSSITILGTRSEHSPLDSAAGPSISEGRARAVASYLRDVWGIQPSRLHIKSRNLPEAASDDHNAYGEAENRRVEIVPSNPSITAPLWTERIEKIATPPHINFDPTIYVDSQSHSVSGIRSATIVVRQREHVLQTFDALTGGSAGEYLWTLDNRSMPDNRDSLTYEFTVTDSAGHQATAEGIIHLRQEVHDRSVHASDTALDRELERYSLILFDYSSSQLDRKEADLIVRDMAKAVGGSVQLTLTGHTDKTGDEQFNDRLAQSRVTRAAEMLSKELQRMGRDTPPMTVESHGSRDVLFDNSLPEGRVLSRTVRALIEKEVGQ